MIFISIEKKGAPDILIKNCRTIINNDGSESELNEEKMDSLKRLQEDWCKLGQRVLVICKKKEKINNVKFEKTSDLEEYLKSLNNLCIVGMVGIIDKPREGIDEVIKTCRGAGVRVFMVTGDFSITAAAIAAQIGIFSSTDYDVAAVMKEKSALAKKNVEPTEKKKKVKDTGPIFKPNPEFKSLLLTGPDLEELEDDHWRTITKYEEVCNKKQIAYETKSNQLKLDFESLREKRPKFL